jgi:Domain of unknown function (DUF4384)
MKPRASCFDFAKRGMIGLATAGLIGTAGGVAQAPRSLIIVPGPPDTQDASEAAMLATDSDLSRARVERLNATVKVENPAGVSVDLIPKLEVPAGAKIGFRIATKKPGYLVLLDVAPSGKLRQIFPNPAAPTHGARDAANVIKPGRPLTIPQIGTPYAGFEFFVDRAAGIAIIVALLSDNPAQAVVDLPDTAPPGFAPDDKLKYVRDQALSPKVLNDGTLEQPNWSIDGKFYLIQ